MTEAMRQSVHDLQFAGGYLIQYSAVAHWCEDPDTKRYALKELLEFADRVTTAAEIIRKEMK